MEVEFGYVREYNTARGFGFVSRTFKSIDRHRKGVWFHITKVKHNYSELARELDAGSSANLNFWYEIDRSEGEKVSRIWLDTKDIPDQQRNDLVNHIEHLWRNIDNSTPQWLDQVTFSQC